MKKTSIISSAFILAGFMVVFGVSPSFSEDIDAFAPSVKSNAMLAIDTSGSMRWPVYNHNLDYEAFFQWAVAAGYASDSNGLSEAYNALPWDKNKIYLTSAYIGYGEINAADGTTHSVTGDPLYEGSTRRERWVTGGIIDTGWEISDWDNITSNTIATNSNGYVVYPDLGDEVTGSSYTATYSSSTLEGQPLANNQNILLTDYRTDPRTNIAKDYGFLGFLKASGIYFSGLFEKSNPYYTLTNNPGQAATDAGKHRVYFFATGNFLSFIKLIEDMKGDGVCNIPEEAGWQNICYQPDTATWSTVSIGPVKNAQYSNDYSSNRNEEYRLVDLNQFPGVKQISIYFQTLDIENGSSGGGCSCFGTGSNNDGVDIVTQNGEILRQNTQTFPETGTGRMFGCDRSGWTGTYDVSDEDTIYIKFKIGSNGGDNCNGYDEGFKITKLKWTATSSGTSEPAGTYSCCNGVDGIGQKIFSRLEVVQQAMNMVVDDTSDTINWGILRWSGSEIDGKAPLGSSSNTVKTAVNALTPDGGTPMGEGMQEAYDYSYDYLDSHQDLAVCSKNYILVLTDGFPSGDDRWSRISKDDHDPDFSSSTYRDSDTWGGDPTQGAEDVPNYSDDVARWMYNSTEADFNFTTHTIGFGLKNPLLQDIADESAGLHLTAYDQEELINAFYSLGLAMADAVSFTAPAISVDQANRAQSGDELYMAFFKPVTEEPWQGNLKKYHLKWYANGTEEVLDATNANATTTDGAFKDTSISLWSPIQDGGTVDKGGAGGLLKTNIDTYFSQQSYYSRVIRTWKNSQMVDFTPANIDNVDLGTANPTATNSTINFVHGYTYDTTTNGAPTATRPWVLGDIIHSEPVVLDYVDNTPQRNLTHRYVAVGANDGMLHVFDSTSGQEKLAFIPEDLLTSLPAQADTEEHEYGVDGLLTKHQTGRNPELLIFGERRGGSSYWALNCTDTNPANWSVEWTISATGEFSELGQTWAKMEPLNNAIGDGRNFGIFTGGYDPLEDDHEGSLPAGDSQGRGIFVIDLSDGSLVFKAVHGDTNATAVDSGTSATTATRTDMDHCFPGGATVIGYPGSPTGEILVIYAVDIAGKVWKVSYNGTDWNLYNLFCANGVGNAGGATSVSGTVDKLDGSRNHAATDADRKCFAAPEVSYAGDCSTDRPILYFGTGDTSHPKSNTVHNRFYAVYDMSHNATMIPLDETDLLNITCDDFGEHSLLTDEEKGTLMETLGNDYNNEAQGWYIRLDGQDDCTSYAGTVDHSGEKITNPARLLNKTLYFNSYIPTVDDPCNPKGIALFYIVRYCYGTPPLDLDPETTGKGISDRYFSVQESTPPSPINIITGPGKGRAIKASAGSKIINRSISIDSATRLYWWRYEDSE